MRNHFATLLILLTALGPNLAVASKIQQQGIKTLADCVAAGATGATCLPLTSQIYDSANSQQLSLSITNGQLGGGGGSKNYLASYVPSLGAGVANTGNGDFELNATTGWSLAHSSLTSLFPTSVASATVPFDSTHGGSAASGNLSLTIESTNPIQKKYSGKLVSSAASTAGDMLISNAFYIDSVDQSQPMTITFGSHVTSGAANLNFSGTSSNSFAIYVYDVTSATWIQPSGVYGMVSSGLFNVKNVVFQPVSSASTRYQLAFINVNASAGAYTLLLDAIGVGPQSAVSAPAMGDWAAYTPTYGAGVGTVTSNNAIYRRVGDSVEIIASFVTGTVASAIVDITLPTGLTIDTVKLPLGNTTSGVGHRVGTWSVSTANQWGNIVTATGTSSTKLYVGVGQGGSASLVPTAASSSDAIAANSKGVGWHAFVPIAGWSSNTASSADTDTRAVAAGYSTLSSTSYTNPNALVYTTQLFDTHAAYNTSTGLYTVPVPGLYKLTIGASFESGSDLNYGIAKNGSVVVTAFTQGISTHRVNGSAQVKCNAGDTLAIVPGASTTFGATDGYLFIERLSGPAVVQATEKYSFSYSNTAGSSITNGSFQLLPMATKEYDDHNSVSSSAFTTSVSGLFHFCGYVGWNSGSNQTTTAIALFKNSSLIKYLGQQPGSATIGVIQGGCADIPLVAGDSVDTRVFHNATGAQAIQTTAGVNYFSGFLVK